MTSQLAIVFLILFASLAPASASPSLCLDVFSENANVARPEILKVQSLIHVEHDESEIRPGEVQASDLLNLARKSRWTENQMVEAVSNVDAHLKETEFKYRKWTSQQVFEGILEVLIRASARPDKSVAAVLKSLRYIHDNTEVQLRLKSKGDSRTLNLQRYAYLAGQLRMYDLALSWHNTVEDALPVLNRFIDSRGVRNQQREPVSSGGAFATVVDDVIFNLAGGVRAILPDAVHRALSGTEHGQALKLKFDGQAASLERNERYTYFKSKSKTSSLGNATVALVRSASGKKIIRADILLEGSRIPLSLYRFRYDLNPLPGVDAMGSWVQFSNGETGTIYVTIALEDKLKNSAVTVRYSKSDVK
jgi:hypothetical protein